MKHLAFASDGEVRAAQFLERSLLPVSAACVVANGVSERLSGACGSHVQLRLWPPAIPDPSAWTTLFAGAERFVVRGSRADAAFVLRPPDALALAALLFGDTPEGAPRALSRLEREVTRRAVAALVPALAPVCGETRLDAAEAAIAPVTYFELCVVAPVACTIGVALAREPEEGVTRTVPQDAVRRASVVMTAEIVLRSLPAREIADLRAGAMLAIADFSAVLRVNGDDYARGHCGVRDGRFAVRVGAA